MRVVIGWCVLACLSGAVDQTCMDALNSCIQACDAQDKVCQESCQATYECLDEPVYDEPQVEMQIEG